MTSTDQLEVPANLPGCHWKTCVIRKGEVESPGGRSRIMGATMNDKPVNSLISAYHDGELTATERAEVDQLLATSPEARAELEAYRQVSRLLREAGRPALDRDLTPVVMQTIEQQMLLPHAAQPLRSRQANWTKWAAVVAAVAMCLIVVVGINLQRDPQAPVVVKNNPVTPDVKPVEVQPKDRDKDGNAVVIAKNDATDVKPIDVGLAPEDLPLDVIENLKKAVPGKIVRYLKQSGPDVTVFHLMVLDVQPGLESLQMILSAQQISGPQEKNGEVGVMAVYVQANQDQMDKVIAELIREEQKQFVALAVQPSVKADVVQKVMKGDPSEATSRQVALKEGELSRLGVAPVPSEQLAKKNRNRSAAGSVQFSQKTTGQADESPMRKVLIVLEKVPDEFLKANVPQN